MLLKNILVLFAFVPFVVSRTQCHNGEKWSDSKNCCQKKSGHKCKGDMKWDQATGQCISPPQDCPSNMEWDAATGECRPSSPEPSGTSKRKNRNRSARATRCPSGLEACPISGLTGQYECFDTATELESCGGCATLGQGQDCTKIEGAWNVACERGICKVYTCEGGYRLDTARNTCLAL